MCVCVSDLSRAAAQTQGPLGLMDVVFDVVDGGEVSQVVSLWEVVTFKELLLHKIPETHKQHTTHYTHNVNTRVAVRGRGQVFLPELFADAVDLMMTRCHQLPDPLSHLRVEARPDDSVLMGRELLACC